MLIRKIRKSDYHAIDRLLLQIHQIDVDNRPDLFRPAAHYMSEDSFESLIANKNVIAFLAQSNGDIIGCCFLSILERSAMAHIKTAYIDLLVVDKKHRRAGIGRSLFKEAQKYAKKVGATRLELTVWKHNPIAECAYRSYGMVPQRCVYEISL